MGKWTDADKRSGYSQKAQKKNKGANVKMRSRAKPRRIHVRAENVTTAGQTQEAWRKTQRYDQGANTWQCENATKTTWGAMRGAHRRTQQKARDRRRHCGEKQDITSAQQTATQHLDEVRI